MEYKTTFFNGIIEEEVSIEQLQTFEIGGKDSHGYVLKINLYGLKQELSAWHTKINEHLQNMGFTKIKVDPNLFFLFVEVDPFFLVLYVDDLFLTW